MATGNKAAVRLQHRLENAKVLILGGFSIRNHPEFRVFDEGAES
jgi:hypothetical protein